MGTGDGTVPVESLKYCATWQGQQSQSVTTEEFSGISHTDMLSVRWLLSSPPPPLLFFFLFYAT